MITIKEVAELAQVSQATVSRVLNSHSTVKEANRTKVYAAIEQLGYKPNVFAQGLASNRSNSIGMLVGTLDGPFYGPLMHHVEDTLRQNNIHLIVTSGQESHTRETDSIAFLSSKQVDGLIIHSDTLSDNELIEVSKTNPRCILLNRYIPELDDKCIFIDNEYGGYLATKHLLDNNHKVIGCVTGQLSKGDSRERLQGYRNALSEYGVNYNHGLVIEGRFDLIGNHDVVRRLLDREPELTAIFCQNDNIALAVYDVAYERGLVVGKDISVVGFDNIEVSRYIRPALSTIHFPVMKMAQEAANGVMQLVKEQEIKINNKLLPELIGRESVAKLP